MARPVYDWVRTFDDMVATGIHKIAGWLMTGISSAAERLTELSRRYPSAPAAIIFSAYEWIKSVFSAGQSLLANLLSSWPSLEYGQSIGIVPGYYVDIVANIRDSGTEKAKRIRTIIRSPNQITADQVNELIKQAIIDEINRIRDQSPGKLPPDFELNDNDWTILAAYRV